MKAPRSNWMSGNIAGAESARATGEASCSSNAAWERRKAVAAPALRAERRLKTADLRPSASIVTPRDLLTDPRSMAMYVAMQGAVVLNNFFPKKYKRLVKCFLSHCA